MTGARECVAGECVSAVGGWPPVWQILAGVVLAGVCWAGVRAGRSSCAGGCVDCGAPLDEYACPVCSPVDTVCVECCDCRCLD